MSADFRDVIETGGTPPAAPSQPFERATPKKPNNVPQSSILELVEGLNIVGISSKMNPEMKEKVLIPLANLLDKYGVSESLGESTTAQAGMGLMSLLGDVAPVIKGLAEYISGQRNSLREEDREFLEKIKDSQGDGGFSDLFVSESESEPTESQPQNIVGPRGENLNGINLSGAKVDWWEVMGVENPTAKAHGMNPQLTEAFFAKDVGAKLPAYNTSADKPSIVGLQSVEDMAADSGINYDDVANSDSKYKEVKNDEANELKQLTQINGMDEHKMPNKEEGDSIFSQPDDLLSDMDMDSFNISFESED